MQIQFVGWKIALITTFLLLLWPQVKGFNFLVLILKKYGGNQNILTMSIIYIIERIEYKIDSKVLSFCFRVMRILKQSN